MLEYPRWKYALVALIMALGFLYAAPNLFPQDPAVQISANRGAVVDAELKERVQATLEKAKLPFKAIELDLEAKRLLVRLQDSEQQNPAQDALRGELGTSFTVALNLASTVPHWMGTIGGRGMTLGLDLQGGVHFLMEVDQRAALEKQGERFVDDIRALLRDKNIRYRSVTRTPLGIVSTLRSEADRDSAFSVITRDLPQLDINNGPVSDESYTLVAKIKETEMRATMIGALQQNVSTLRNRINALGVAEPIIQQQGESRIVVQLPGVQDTAAAKRLISATATLEYRAVDNKNSVADAVAGNVPAESKLYFSRQGDPVLLSKRVIATGDQLVDASSGFDADGGTPTVSVVLDNVGGRHMQDFTNENVGNGMAVVFIERLPEIKTIDGKQVRTTRIDEKVISIANVREPFGKRFQTTGLDSPQEAADLALLLKAGALAAPIDIVEERVAASAMRPEMMSGVRASSMRMLSTSSTMA